ncbi:MAG: hypothetical protein ACI4JM_01375 [Oscillospiraceae bacterium]
MWHIAKAQFYQLGKESIIKIIFLLILAVQTISVVSYVISGIADETAVSAGQLTAELFPAMATFPFIFIFIAVGDICCSDYGDKTANYEIMSGHTRYDSYFGRVIPCITVGTSGYILLTLFPILTVSAFIGWGEKVSAADIFLRWFMTIFPIIRLICEFVFLSFLFRKSYIIYIGGYIIYQAEMLLIQMMGTNSYLLGFSNIKRLSEIEIWTSFGLSDKLEYYIYDASVTAADCISTITVSLIFSAASLYLGYVFFRNDDLN